jgi:hypothetical protein
VVDKPSTVAPRLDLWAVELETAYGHFHWRGYACDSIDATVHARAELFAGLPSPGRDPAAWRCQVIACMQVGT